MTNQPTILPKILVVDDDRALCKILYEFLKKDFEIRTANSVAQAEEILFADFLPDIFLVDVMIPETDGFTFCQRVKNRAETTEIPFIFITGIRDSKIEAKGLALGAVDYISKPFHNELLRARLRNHIALKQQRDSLHEILNLRHKLTRQEENVQATKMLVRDLFETMDLMLVNRDHYTSEHAIRVAEISRRIAMTYGFTNGDLEAIELGCLVHDIGKIAIPDDVLLKPGRFDLADRKIMELHPLIGATLFAKRQVDARIIEIIQSHHERLDGSGYPHGLKGNAISPWVRIVMVADVYEALVAMRPYKSPMPRDIALKILDQEVAQGKMDADVVRTLKEVTADWDPLSIRRTLTATYSETLETFRRKTYFREPLSEFYNYRYLLAMDDKKMMIRDRPVYHILMIDFVRLREFNKQYGYVRADEILNDLGARLHQTVNALKEEATAANPILLVRKGADYLIYASCAEELLARLLTELKENLLEEEKQYGLKARLLAKRFTGTQPISEAMNEMFRSEQNDKELLPPSVVASPAA